MNDLKDALLKFPALQLIDYKSEAPVILSVDTSHIVVGYLLAQCDLKNPWLRYYAKFGLITLNDQEACFSQAKLELYGLYRVLRALKPLLIGIRNFFVEVDAKYIKGMLKNPDVAPSASMNRWILSILLFHFTLVHVPGSHHGPDGLSRRRPQPGDREEDEEDKDFEDWVDKINGFMHMINPSPSYRFQSRAVLAAPPIACYILESTHDHTAPPEEPTEDFAFSYEDVPCSAKAVSADLRIRSVRQWLHTLDRLKDITDDEYKTFMRYCTEFFLAGEDDRLWRKDLRGAHKIVIPQERRLFLISSAHNDVGHHGFYATNALLAERYWWPAMGQDIAWFVKTCQPLPA